MKKDDLFPSLGHTNGGWLAKYKGRVGDALNSRDASLRRQFRTYLDANHISLENAHLIALTITDETADQASLYTGIQKDVWDQLNKRRVFIGAFSSEQKLKQWKCFDSDFTTLFKDLKDDGIHTNEGNKYPFIKSGASDGRILITVKPDESWKKVEQ